MRFSRIVSWLNIIGISWISNQQYDTMKNTPIPSCAGGLVNIPIMGYNNDPQ
jgi:hypothetical protein